MAPLYKRYIPPKPPAATTLVPQIPSSKSAPSPTTAEEPKKRKRERPEEEVAERKAKKLRKKGIDPASVVISKPANGTEKVHAQPEEPKPADAKAKVIEPKPPRSNGVIPTLEPENEFAHIKDIQKRHKHEKKARNARIAAEKAATSKNINGLIEDSDDSRHRASEVDVVARNAYNNQDVRGEPNATEVADTESTNHKKRRKRDLTALTNGSERASSTNGTLNNIEGVEGSNSRNIDSNGESEDHITTPNVEGDGVDSTSLLKKRRHKLESVLREPLAQDVAETLDDKKRPVRHKGVLDKYQKSTELSQTAPTLPKELEDAERTHPTLLDLVPLPQPEKAPIPEFVPDSAALPDWLAKPIVVSSDSTTLFSALGPNSTFVDHLSKLGFKDALPIQQALIPMLLPSELAGARYRAGTEKILPDMVVSAPTGSGKTMAYLLPIIESLRAQAGNGKMKALVVVPTRELVMQIAAVAEVLARGSSIKIGMATGGGALRNEQVKLVSQKRKHDPGEYKELMAKAHQRDHPPNMDSEEFDQYLETLDEQNVREEERIQEVLSSVQAHVPIYDSTADILIATPGRLLEHLSSTLGFSLAYIQWLVLDEADKLLDLQYDGFLNKVNTELSRASEADQHDANKRCLRPNAMLKQRPDAHVRKVVLSATMTKDVSKLMKLELKWPQMVVVRGAEEETMPVANGNVEAQVADVRAVGDGFELPLTLSEYCVPVGDGSEKPLYLAELLRTRVLQGREGHSLQSAKIQDDLDDAQSGKVYEDSSSESESSLDSESSSDTSIDDDSDNDDDDKRDVEPGADQGSAEPEVDLAADIHPARAAMLDRLSKRMVASAAVPTVLIFTSSTESANRLSHLLGQLKPAWSSWINTMTRSNSKRKSTIKGSPEQPMIMISTDRAGRGLDVIGNRTVTHVVQYDVPRSITSYVHRVGRTARVGKSGEAWTLYIHSEARWFMKDITKTKKIKRSGEVEKVKLMIEDQDLQKRFGEVVAEMRDEVHGRSK